MEPLNVKIFRRIFLEFSPNYLENDPNFLLHLTEISQKNQSNKKNRNTVAPALTEKVKSQLAAPSAVEEPARQTTVTAVPDEPKIYPPKGNCPHSFRSDFTENEFFVKSKVILPLFICSQVRREGNVFNGFVLWCIFVCLCFAAEPQR
jgi:hypothetical protein